MANMIDNKEQQNEEIKKLNDKIDELESKENNINSS